MEVIELSSYLEFEKAQIAHKYLIPKQLERHGMADCNVRFTDDAIALLINGYTKEAGVRNLERQIASVIRKTAQEIVQTIGDEPAMPERTSDEELMLIKPPLGRKALKNIHGDWLKDIARVRAERLEELKRERSKERVITTTELHDLLKVPPFRRRPDDTADKVGVVTGLAWTSVGGDILPVEVTIMPSGIAAKDKLTLTGKLGDVMKESAMAALSYVRANAGVLGVPEEFAKEREIHIHVPEGAIPKDGPSAGITMTIALISAASGKAVRGDVAMTGEVTLRGNVLAIGGLNEKLLAAKKAGIKTIIIPRDNEPDLADMQPQTKEGLTIIAIAHASEALPFVFR
jgi:ATP-dependent Lon protease